jgi:hypothetical protein
MKPTSVNKKGPKNKKQADSSVEELKNDNSSEDV